MIEKAIQEAKMLQKTLGLTGWNMKTLVERIILSQLFEKLMIKIVIWKIQQSTGVSQTM